MAARHLLPSPAAHLSADGLGRQANDENTFLESHPANKKPQFPRPALAESSPSAGQPNYDLRATYALYLRQTTSSSSRSSSPRPPAVVARKSIHRDLLDALSEAKASPTCVQYHCQSSDRPTTSAFNRYPRVRYPTGAPGAESERKDPKPLLSPMLLESLSNPASARLAVENCEFRVHSKSEWENERPSGSSLLDRNLSNRSNQSVWNHGRDIGFSPGKSQPRSSETIKENDFYPKPDSIVCVESPHPDFPQRKLSYSGTLKNLELGTWEKATRSGRLKRKAGWSTKKGYVERQVVRKSSASEDTQSSVSYRTISHGHTPPDRRPGLESDAPELQECIEEAHLAVMTSPSKPQIITIPRRSCPIFPLPDESGPVLDPAPATPPETPVTVRRVRKRIDKPLEPERARQDTISARKKLEDPITPPNSTASGLQVVRSLQPDDSYEPSPHSFRIVRHQPTDWVLDDLECIIAGFPKTKLQLDSPVIQHLRLRLGRSADDSGPTSRMSPSKAPHSRYSIFKPLSSHPVTPKSPPTPGHTMFHDQSPAPFDPLHPTPSSTNPTLGALQTIFPNAASPALECLQATYLALNYISIMGSAPISQTRLPSTGPETPCSLSNIPPKARAMLGILSNPSPKTSRPRPQPLEQGDDEPSGRIQYLTVKLRNVIRHLLGDVCGRRLEVWDDAFLRAVGEMVRMGEERRLV